MRTLYVSSVRRPYPSHNPPRSTERET
jgi:hypothetical protein